MDDTANSLSDPGTLPVLDLGAFLAAEPGAAENLATELRSACESLGFFFLTNHGISKDLINRIFTETERFHSQPQAKKDAIAINQNQRGYVKPGATLVSHSTYNENTKFDSNETLVMATEHRPDNPGRQTGKRFYGENQWPDGLPGFKDTVTEFMETMTNFGKSLLPVWA
ncbi:MAG: 2-oxoglutarate and iron-dependent oxygenase domain-containing protein, partial [Rhodospirillales bacterium]|nr:2-oxoglutarate and iron-dependent oxygenase domain-containing protein [Rhodospirillales bacterium]